MFLHVEIIFTELCKALVRVGLNKPTATHSVRRWTIRKKVVKCSFEILGESRRVKVLLRAKLASGLSHNGINDIQSWQFIFRLTLQ